MLAAGDRPRKGENKLAWRQCCSYLRCSVTIFSGMGRGANCFQTCFACANCSADPSGIQELYSISPDVTALVMVTGNFHLPSIP